MFRNLTIFLADGIGSVTESAARARPFAPCLASEERSIGWAPARGEDRGALVEAVDYHFILLATLERRRVPGDAVKRAVDEACRKIEAEEGFKPGRARKREIKEDMRDALIAKAIPTRAHTRVWIDRKAGTLAIESASAAMIDDVVSLLVRTFDGLQLRQLATTEDPRTVITNWLLTNDLPDTFHVGRDADMIVPDGRGTMKLRNRDLFVEVSAGSIRMGMLTDRIALEHERASFVLSPSLQLRRIKVEFDAVGEPDPDVDPFDANVTIACGALREVIADLVEAFGGLRQEEGAGE
jgi:recombination associated protein RdgC